MLVERANQLQQGLVVQLGQHGAGLGAGQQAEDVHALGQGQLTERGGDIGGVGVLEDLAQAFLAAAAQELLDRLGEAGGFFHAATADRRAARPRTG